LATVNNWPIGIMYCILTITDYSVFIFGYIFTGLCQLPLIMSLVKLQDANINLCNTDGMTPLMIIAEAGDSNLCDVSKTFVSMIYLGSLFVKSFMGLNQSLHTYVVCVHVYMLPTAHCIYMLKLK